jgi:hypothetical protein
MLIRFGVQGRYFVVQFAPIADLRDPGQLRRRRNDKAMPHRSAAPLSIGHRVVEVLMLAN